MKHPQSIHHHLQLLQAVWRRHRRKKTRIAAKRAGLPVTAKPRAAKMKTKSSVKKRFKMTASGKLKAGVAGKKLTRSPVAAPRRQNVYAARGRVAHTVAPVVAALKHISEAGASLDVKDVVNLGLAQIAVHKQHLVTSAGKDQCKVRVGHGLAFARYTGSAGKGLEGTGAL